MCGTRSNCDCACSLPPLEWDQGLARPPRNWSTIWDLAAYLRLRFPDWQSPVLQTLEEWREAQIFAGVRAVLVEVGNLNPDQVVRDSRLQADLGLE